MKRRTSPFTRLHKKQVTWKDKMYRVTYKYIRLKCYIKFFCMAPHEVAGSPMLARALDNFYLFLNDFKKENNHKSNFLIQTLSSSQIQINVSPLFNSNFSTTSDGIVVFNESDLFVLYPIFVNCFITNHSIFVINLIILCLVI